MFTLLYQFSSFVTHKQCRQFCKPDYKIIFFNSGRYIFCFKRKYCTEGHEKLQKRVTFVRIVFFAYIEIFVLVLLCVSLIRVLTYFQVSSFSYRPVERIGSMLVVAYCRCYLWSVHSAVLVSAVQSFISDLSWIKSIVKKYAVHTITPSKKHFIILYFSWIEK